MRGKGKRVAMWAGALGLAVLIATGVALKDSIREEYWLRRFFEPLGTNAQGYSEYRHRKTGIVFVRLPGGKFWMGAQSEDPKAPNYDPEARPEEGPVHEVTLSPFLIAKCEVSQAEWERAMGGNPSYSRGADFPVERVSWDDCQEFEAKTGLVLPTEAQWEYACRATSGPYAGTGKLEDMGGCAENSGDKTHPVGRKQPNRFGLHDMQGNAWEWCQDVYDAAFYATPEAARLDPVRTSGPSSRVRRGGAFSFPDVPVRCAFRFWDYPNSRSHFTGLRVVASPFSDL